MQKILLSCAYVFAAAVFTSMAAMSVYQAVMLILCLYLAFQLSRKKKLNLAPSQMALLGYFFVAGLSLIVNGKPALLLDQMGGLGRMVMGALLVYAIAAFFEIPSHARDRHLRRLVLVFLIAVSLAHISGLIGYFFGFNPLKMKVPKDPLRAMGMYGMAITYGNGCQFLLLLLLGVFTQYRYVEKYVPKKLLIVAILTTALGLLFSFTRGGVIGVLLGAPFLFIRSSPKLFKRVVLAIAACAGVVVVVMATVPPQNRLSYRSESNMIRISQYQTAWYAFLEKPIFGHGFRQFSKQVERIKLEHDLPFKDFLGNTHNNFAEALVGTGLIGFIVFAAFVLLWLREILSMKHFLMPTILSIWVAFFVSGQFQVTFTDGENMHLIYPIYALGLWISRHRT